MQHQNTSVSPPKQKQGSFGPQSKLQSIYAMSFPSLDEEKSTSIIQTKISQHGSQKQILNLAQASSFQNQQPNA
jgi:hypothetical protein